MTTMNTDPKLTETLANAPIFKDYERAYTEATGLPLALRPVESWQQTLQGRRGENPFCALMTGKSSTCAACLQMQERLARCARDGAATTTCAFGLSELAVPVKVGHRTVGLLQTGQVLRQKPTRSAFDRAMKQAGELGVAVDLESARSAWFQTRVVPQRKLNSLAHLLATFADHLSIVSNQLVVRQACYEPPLVTRARHYIEEHQTEDLSLGQVARAVNASIFHFCKVFKKALGITFTQFVSRTRIESAKKLLLNPNIRVSEVAYQVGFQSLTHFNRVFKVVAGQSPTEYREQLPTAA